MRLVIYSTIVALVFFSFTGCKSIAHENKFEELLESRGLNRPVVMAHRGRMDKDFPENALESFGAINQFSQDLIVEFDVRVTMDSIHVLLHDETLDRTTTGEGLLSGHTFKELLKYNLVEDSSGVTTNYRVPTFRDVLNWGKTKNLLAIDAKPECSIDTIVKYVEIENMLGNCFVICYSMEDAKKYHQLNADLILALGFNSWDAIEKIKRSRIPYENLIALTPTTLQSKKFYGAIRELGIYVAYGTYKTIDKKEFSRAKSFYEQYAKQFDIITTDRAKSVFQLLQAKK